MSRRAADRPTSTHQRESKIPKTSLRKPISAIVRVVAHGRKFEVVIDKIATTWAHHREDRDREDSMALDPMAVGTSGRARHSSIRSAPKRSVDLGVRRRCNSKFPVREVTRIMAVGSRGLYDTPTKSGAKSVRAVQVMAMLDARRARSDRPNAVEAQLAVTLGKATLKARRSAVSDFARLRRRRAWRAPAEGVVYIHACPRADVPC